MSRLRSRSMRLVLLGALVVVLSAAPAVAAPGSAASGRFLLSCVGSSGCVTAAPNGVVLGSVMQGSSAEAQGRHDLGASSVSSLACSKGAICAVGDSEGDVFVSTLSAMSPTSSWVKTKAGQSAMNSMTCPADNLCLGGDAAGDIWALQSQGAVRSWVKVFDDPSISYTCQHYGKSEGNCGTRIEAVACPTTSLCVATDSSGRILESNDPTKSGSWTFIPGGSQIPAEAFNSVSCPTAQFCAAVDATGGSLVTWSPSASPGVLSKPIPVSGSSLAAVACTSARECIVSDDAGALLAPESPKLSGQWAPIVQPSQGNAERYFSSLSCTSLTSCFAIDNRGRMTAVAMPTAGSMANAAITDLGAISTGISALPTVATVMSERKASIRQATAAATAGAPALLKALLTSAQSTAAPAMGPQPLPSSTTGSSAAPSATPTSLAPAVATEPDYGIADGPSECGPATDWSTDVNGFERCSDWRYGFNSYFANTPSAFTTLRANLPITHARFFIPYDAVSYYDTQTGQCAPSPEFTTASPGRIAGQEYWTLFNELQNASAIGLTPLLVPAQGINLVLPAANTQTGATTFTNPKNPSGVPETGLIPPYPDFNSTVDEHDWDCGIQGIVSMLQTDNVMPKNWETMNEPDPQCVYETMGQGGCDPASTGHTCQGLTGPDQAADLFEDEFSILADDTGEGGTTVAAGVFSHPNTAYLDDYLCWSVKFGYFADRISFHDYFDTTGYFHVNGNPAALDFVDDLDSQYAEFAGGNPSGVPAPKVWITEAAADLTNMSAAYSNGDSTANCLSHGQVFGQGTLGCEIDGNPTAQQTDAHGFLDLSAQASQTEPGQVAQVFWYQFQAQNASTGFDSALLEPGPPLASLGFAQSSPDGVYGTNSQSTGARLSYCVLAGLAATSCNNTVTTASDWSIQPRQDAGDVSPGSTTITNVTGINLLPDAGAWVTCYSLVTNVTCDALSPNTRVVGASEVGGVVTWQITPAPPSTIAAGNYQLDVSTSHVPPTTQ
jgi:hypothetical protein